MVSKQLVLCVGDSHTKGVLGADWVSQLAKQNPNLYFLRAAVNGEPSESIAKRLPIVLQQHPKPFAVTLLAGTNDCLACESEQFLGFYRRLFKIHEVPSKDVYIKNMASILKHLAQVVPESKVIVITLPPITEQPSHSANARVQEYNTALKQLLAKDYPVVEVADLHSSCIQYLQESAPAYKGGAAAAADGGAVEQAPEPLYSFTLINALRTQLSSALQHWLLWRSWNSISASRGRRLLSDAVHMNDTAAELLVKTLQPLLQQD